jgi:hypothetical protein
MFHIIPESATTSTVWAAAQWELQPSFREVSDFLLLCFQLVRYVPVYTEYTAHVENTYVGITDCKELV